CALDYIVPERAVAFRRDGEQSGSIAPPPLSLWGLTRPESHRIRQTARDETSLPRLRPTDPTRERGAARAPAPNLHLLLVSRDRQLRRFCDENTVAIRRGASSNSRPATTP